MGGVGLRSRSALLPLFAVGIVVIDQLVKFIVRARLPLGEPVPVIPHLLWFTHVRNTGGAFSILAGRQWLFMLAASLVVIAVFVMWGFTRMPRVQAVAMGLVAGGAAGNLIDRFAYRKVTDYIDVGFWPVFNVADIAVVTGVCLLGAWVLLAYRDERDSDEAGDGDTRGSGGVAEGPREGS